MKVIIAPEAAEQIFLRERWWRAHRTKAPGRFEQELADALVQIGQMPESFPVYSERAGRIVRRCILTRTSCHLYFEIMRSTGEVWILAARGAAQRRGPRLPRR